MGILNKKNIKGKYITPLVQLVIIAFLFIFVFDKECVLVFKNILDKLQICENYQAMIYNLLIPIKLFCHSPSLIAFLFVTLQLVCITTTILFVINIFQKPNLYVDEYVKKQKYTSYEYIDNKNSVYLENLRLLC